MISVFIDYKLEKYVREIKYSLDFVFQTLGYSHRYIKSPEHLKERDILLIYGFAEPSNSELAVIARHYITLFIPADPNLYEAKAWTPDRLRRNIREVKLLSMTPVISERKFELPAEYYSDSEIHAGKINFDVAGNAFFHLAHLEPQMDSHRDERGLYPDESSAFHPWQEIPYIDNLLWLLDSMIKELTRAKGQYICQKSYWPEGQQLALSLTHTVDTLQKWDFNRIVLSTIDDFIMFCTFKWKSLARNINSKFKYLFTNFEMYWNFDEFRKVESDYHVHSVWFFAAEACAEIDYSLDDSDLQSEIQQILREGHEIALLATEDKLNRDDFVTRKQIMLHQIGREQIGMRQLNYKQEERLKDLQLKLDPAYDSSSSFLESPGFKNGFSLPYYQWISAIQANFPELPVTYRDVFLKINRYRYLQLEDAKRQIKKIFQSTLRTRGILGVDFNVASYTDVPNCEKIYRYLLALIKSAKVWSSTPLEIASWWYKRNRITIEEGEYEISVYFPDELETFTLQIFNSPKVVEVTGAEASIEGHNLKFCNIKPKTVAIISLFKPE